MDWFLGFAKYLCTVKEVEDQSIAGILLSSKETVVKQYDYYVAGIGIYNTETGIAYGFIIRHRSDQFLPRIAFSCQIKEFFPND